MHFRLWIVAVPLPFYPLFASLDVSSKNRFPGVTCEFQQAFQERTADGMRFHMDVVRE